MSNFAGVTFTKQAISPSDDAIVRRALLSDGILTGCAFTYSGSTLTMASGHLMICGRQIKHPASQNWAVVDATSGFARLVLTIDMTRTATKDAFDQVIDSIEYASAVDGFVNLEQSDINGSGTRYQVAACVVSLGAGGITGIVSQLERSEGGGAGLNFSVVGSEAQPSGPKENMIWAITSTPVKEWVFSSKAPSDPIDNLLWIQTSDASAVEFNALKKNGIAVYPIAGMQYIGGKWVSVVCKTYQNEVWQDWSKILLPAEDILDRIVTGGQLASASYDSGVLTLSLRNTSYAYFEEDVSNYKTLEIIGHKSAGAVTYDVGILGSDNKLVAGSNLDGKAADFRVVCDISTISGAQKIGVKCNLASQNVQNMVVTITSIVLK